MNGIVILGLVFMAAGIFALTACYAFVVGYIMSRAHSLYGVSAAAGALLVHVAPLLLLLGFILLHGLPQ